MNIPAARGFFITGSDTDVGKTYISSQLVDQLNAFNISVKVRKPIESGCKKSTSGDLIPSDGLALYYANHQKEDLQTITPYRFQAALAPDRAASLEHQIIKLDQLIQAVNNNLSKDDLLLVEGAGGFYSPLCSDGLNADLASHLQLTVIIVVENRLGAINQALLTMNAVEQKGLKIHAIILNQIQQSEKDEMDNLADLKNRTSYPVLYNPFKGTLAQNIFDPLFSLNNPKGAMV